MLETRTLLAAIPLSASAVSPTEIDLTAGVVAGEQLEMQGPQDQNFHLIATTGTISGTSMIYQVTNLTPNSLYSFRVRYYDATFNAIVYTNAWAATLANDGQNYVLDTPTNVGGGGAGGGPTVYFNWDPDSDNDYPYNQDYSFEFSVRLIPQNDPHGLGTINWDDIEVDGNGSDYSGDPSYNGGTQFKYGGPAPNGTYFAQVQVDDFDGDFSQWSNIGIVSSSGSAIATPPAPQQLQITQTTNTTTTFGWTWNQPPYWDYGNFALEGVNSSNQAFSIPMHSYSQSGSNYVGTVYNSDMAAATSVFMVVEWTAGGFGGSGTGVSGYSNFVNVNAGATVVPAAPTNLTTTGENLGQGYVATQVLWNNNSNNETGYLIERSFNGGAFSQIATVNADVSFYVDNSITVAGTYSYEVCAANGSTTSAFTNSAYSIFIPDMGENGSGGGLTTGGNGIGGGSGGGGGGGGGSGVSLTAYRTGGNFGQAVSQAVQQGGDPSQYVNLVDDNYDVQGVGGTPDDQLTTCKTDGSDPDVIKITLNGISGQNSGGIWIDFYGSGWYLDDIGETIFSGLKLFKSDGTEMHLGDFYTSVANPSGYLAPLASGGSVTIYCEAMFAWPDDTFNYFFVGNNNQFSSASVSMDVVDLTFQGTDGRQMVAAAPVWKDALIAAATDPSGPWQDPINAGGQSSDSFFRAYLSGLTSNFSGTLQIQSDDDPSDTYSEEVTPALSSEYIYSYTQQKFGVLYNGDMIYAPSGDDAALTSTEQSEIENNLMLYALHNPGATATLTTNFDVQKREIQNMAVLSIALNNDLVNTGDPITGTINSVEGLNLTNYSAKIYNSSGQDVLNPTTSDDGTFQFSLSQPGLYTLDVTANDNVAPVEMGGCAIYVNNAAAQNIYAQEAWEALRLTSTQPGTVPANPVWRNRLITSHYADTFNAHPSLYWAGMASFVSATAGNAIASAATVYEALSGADGFDSDSYVPILGNMVISRQTIGKSYQLLALGNFDIYINIYPTILAYFDPNGGMTAIDAMVQSGYILPAMANAWGEVDEGINTNNDADLWLGIESMTAYEQNDVLQPAIFDPNADFWTNFTNNPNYSKYITSLIPNTTPYIFVVNGSFGVAANRLQWLNDNLLPNWQDWLDSNPGAIDVTTLYSGGYQ